MAFKTLRAAISRSSNSSNSSANSSPASTASSSATDLSSSSPTDTTTTAALSPITTVPTGLTLTSAPTTTTLSSSPTSTPLQKTPSRLRALISRTKELQKKSKAKNFDADWHDYTGPRKRFRRVVDPVHRAQLEAWELNFGRRCSFGGNSYLDGASPFASPRVSMQAPDREEHDDGNDSDESQLSSSGLEEVASRELQRVAS